MGWTLKSVTESRVQRCDGPPGAAAFTVANIVRELRGARLGARIPDLQAMRQENAVSSLYDFDIPSSERVILAARETMGRNDPLKLVFFLALAMAPLLLLNAEPFLHETSS